MHPPVSFPAVQILKGNGQILRVRLDMLGNAPPQDRAVLPQEVVIGGAHLWWSMPMQRTKGKWP